MPLPTSAKLLRIHLGEGDRFHGRPLHLALVEAFRRAGLAGATVYRGVEGYGSHSVVHAARLFELASQLPMVVEVIDAEDRIRAILPEVRAMAPEGLITLETVEIVGPVAQPAKE